SYDAAQPNRTTACPVMSGLLRAEKSLSGALYSVLCAFGSGGSLTGLLVKKIESEQTSSACTFCFGSGSSTAPGVALPLARSNETICGEEMNEVWLKAPME